MTLSESPPTFVHGCCWEAKRGAETKGIWTELVMADEEEGRLDKRVGDILTCGTPVVAGVTVVGGSWRLTVLRVTWPLQAVCMVVAASSSFLRFSVRTACWSSLFTPGMAPLSPTKDGDGDFQWVELWPV